MRLNWPMKFMDVGDFAVVHGVHIGKVKQALSMRTYITGHKYASKRRTGADGREYVLIRRYADDGTEPQGGTPQVFYMDAAEQAPQGPDERRAMERQLALADRLGALALESTTI